MGLEINPEVSMLDKNLISMCSSNMTYVPNTTEESEMKNS